MILTDGHHRLTFTSRAVTTEPRKKLRLTYTVNHSDEMFGIAISGSVSVKANVMQTKVDRGDVARASILAYLAPLSSHSRLHDGSSTPSNSNLSGSDMGLPSLVWKLRY